MGNDEASDDDVSRCRTEASDPVGFIEDGLLQAQAGVPV